MEKPANRDEEDRVPLFRDFWILTVTVKTESYVIIFDLGNSQLWGITAPCWTEEGTNLRLVGDICRLVRAEVGRLVPSVMGAVGNLRDHLHCEFQDPVCLWQGCEYTPSHASRRSSGRNPGLWAQTAHQCPALYPWKCPLFFLISNIKNLFFSECKNDSWFV